MHVLKFTTPLLLFALIFVCANPARGQIQQIQEELQRLPIIKDSISLVNSLNRLGALYRTRNADSCFYYGMKAKQTATNIRYRSGQVEADHVIAYALFKRGLYAEALELLSKLLSHYQQFDDTEKIVRVYLDMVEIGNKGIFDREKLISLLQKAIHAGKKLEKDSIMSEVYIYYCNRNTTLTEDSIRFYLDKSTEIASRYNDESMLIFNQLWKVRLLASNGKMEEALPLAKQALVESQRIGNAILEINSLIFMVNYHENNPKRQLEYLYREFEVAQRSGHKYLEIYILNNALWAAKLTGDKDEIIKAYAVLEKAMIAEWENSKKFMGDYVKYNAIQNDNKLLSEKNAQRTLWLGIISAAASIIVLIIYLVMLRRSRKAKEQVEALNNAANRQIIAMEEAKHQAVKEEQLRLGQDLHDGLSSSIASIKHQLELLSMDTDDVSLKHKLGRLQTEIATAYETARSKSHEWFSAAGEQEEQSFEQQIKLLTDGALPDNRYQKDIQIDDHALLRVNADIRIALLRIIQEAITNIIKHAKAKHVSILIYEEMDSLVLIVSDDGKGLEEKKPDNAKSTIGLQSIRRRVRYLNGEINIQSDAKGTEITISIPLVIVKK